jgi:osmotically-inducible protein OsmY
LRKEKEVEVIAQIPSRKEGVLFTVLLCFALLVLLFGCSQADTTVQERSPPTDEEIIHAIGTAFLIDERVPYSPIAIEVNEGIVTLTGTVGTQLAKRRATTVAKLVKGVRAVVNRINVHAIPAEGHEPQADADWIWLREGRIEGNKYATRSDKEIKDAVHDALFYDPRVIRLNPEIDVDNGVVTLRGIVDSLQGKKAAEEDAKNVVGASQVHNLLEVRSEEEVGDELLAQKVKEALSRDTYVNRHDILVVANDGEVELYGTVDSEFEMKHAAKVAAQTSRVVLVENHLKSESVLERSGVAGKRR